VLVGAGSALFNAARAQRAGNTRAGLMWSYAGYAATLILTGIATFPEIDRWQNLPGLAYQIHEDSRNRPLALLDPDETTIAMLDHRLRTRFQIITTEHASARDAVATWLRSQGPQARVLVKMPGRTPGQIARFLQRVRPMPAQDDGIAGRLSSDGTTAIVRRYELPEGRRYALLGPSAATARAP
jgi:hypothetical protein